MSEQATAASQADARGPDHGDWAWGDEGAAIPPDAGKQQLESMKEAFFAGAQHLFASIMGILEDGEEPTPADLKRLDLIDGELKTFIAEFERRFSLFAGSTSHQPGGLYREPATVDLISDQPGWIRYQGFNSPASLGPPALAAGRLISELIQASGPGTSWRVSPGARGGSAR